MHTHQVAIPAWRWRHQKVAATEPLLKRIAAERIIVLSAGGSDWIGGSGEAVRVEGGYRVSGRKSFTSGAPAGDILMAGAIVHEEGADSVIHFGVNLKAPQVRVMDSWRALGMRGTGSHDVLIEDLFIPDAAIAFKRLAGVWHPVFQVIATTAFPLVYAAYLGVAEAAREQALAIVRQRSVNEDMLQLAGRMDTALCGARLAHGWMLDVVDRNAPGAESVNDVMTGRTLVADHAIRTVELAMELVGGGAMQRGAGIERLFRDIQGARYHALREWPQSRYAGAMALGLPVDKIW
jgi:alkylation response protein AidB-like acyl-CoA dehydrogenase